MLKRRNKQHDVIKHCKFYGEKTFILLSFNLHKTDF